MKEEFCLLLGPYGLLPIAYLQARSIPGISINFVDLIRKNLFPHYIRLIWTLVIKVCIKLIIYDSNQ